MNFKVFSKDERDRDQYNSVWFVVRADGVHAQEWYLEALQGMLKKE